MSSPQLYMQRALDLAARGLGKVRPNPLVGCVIVHDDLVTGEGWHQQYGGPHAEVMAIENVSDKKLLNKSTVYVTLEPCAHHGKTPPCVDLLISYGVPRVVVAQRDPNPVVDGGGIKKLQDAGFEVVIGVLESEAVELNKRFHCYVKNKRPFIVLKWAATTESNGHPGFIAKENYDSKWISNAYSRKLVHQWRAEEAAVLVGTNTAHFDNPKLNVRGWLGLDPIRIVIDKNLRLAPELHLFSDDNPTLCYNLSKEQQLGSVSWVQLPEKDFMAGLFYDLYQRGIQSVLVEGGAALHETLLDKHLWDEIRVFKANKKFGSGIEAPYPQGKRVSTQKIQDDILTHYRRVNG